MKDLSLVVDEIPKKRVVIIGDIILDHYLDGKSTRVSPEASIPIISIEKEWFALGGAGNTAVNVRSLDASATVIGQVGSDYCRDRILESLLVGITARVVWRYDTIVKFRILSEGRHIVRADKDGSCDDVDEDIIDKLQDFVMKEVEFCNAVLVSDYAKGAITERFARELVRISREHRKMLIVDTKPKHFSWFKGCYCIKPNKIEAEEFTGIKIEFLEDAEKAGLKIKNELETNVLLTLGSMGMILFEEERTTRFTSNAKEVFDVTGAGDTVLAVFSLALVSGASFRQAADLANHAAGIVIAKSGTASVTLEELKKSLS